MSAVFAQRSWPATAPVASGPAFGLRDGEGDRVCCWVLRRNCSLTPRQLGVFYLSLCAVSLGIGGFFAMQGAAFVLGFAGVEVVAVGVALLVYARHALDRETLTLRAHGFEVERRHGARTEVVEIDLDRLSVAISPGGLIQLSGGDRPIEVGRFLRGDLRAGLAAEIRRAVREKLVTPLRTLP